MIMPQLPDQKLAEWQVISEHTAPAQQCFVRPLPLILRGVLKMARGEVRENCWCRYRGNVQSSRTSREINLKPISFIVQSMSGFTFCRTLTLVLYDAHVFVCLFVYFFSPHLFPNLSFVEKISTVALPDHAPIRHSGGDTVLPLRHSEARVNSLSDPSDHGRFCSGRLPVTDGCGIVWNLNLPAIVLNERRIHERTVCSSTDHSTGS